MQSLKRIVAALVTVIMIMTIIPTTKATTAEKSTSDTVADLKKGQQVTSEADEFWENLHDEKIYTKSGTVSDYMKQAYELVKATGKVKDLKWESDKGFAFTLENGIHCVYDYEIRQASLKKCKGTDEVTVTDYRDETKANCTNSNVVLFGPYYGYDSSFKEDYKDMGEKLAEAKNGTFTIYSGSEATPAAVRSEVAKKGNAIILFDSHGSSYFGTSYFCINSSVGIAYSDYQNYWAVSYQSGAYGIDGNFMTRGNTVSIDNTFCWFAICEGMMTDGLCAPLRACGASVVYGYSQSVSFTKDYQYMNVFWPAIIAGKTVAEAAATMKSKYGNYDNYANPYAYPIFVSDQDSYPQNPDSVQTVKTNWTYISDDVYYTVTFKDWDGTILSKQSVIENGNAVAPTAPTRAGYTFTGWDKAYTNITADTVITAQYKSVIPVMTFSSTDVLPGNQATITISLSSIQGINHLAFTLNYNADKVRLISVTNGELFGEFTQSGNTLTWQATRCAFDNKAIEKALCTLVFEVDKNALPDDDLRIALSDINITVDGTVHQLTGDFSSCPLNVVEYVLGDIDRNGEINTVDAIHLLRYLADWGNTIDTKAADINGSGDVNTVDALLLLRYLAGFNVSFMN